MSDREETLVVNIQGLHLSIGAELKDWLSLVSQSRRCSIFLNKSLGICLLIELLLLKQHCCSTVEQSKIKNGECYFNQSLGAAPQGFQQKVIAAQLKPPCCCTQLDNTHQTNESTSSIHGGSRLMLLLQKRLFSCHRGDGFVILVDKVGCVKTAFYFLV